jgi:16S rRNA processing protein RimM
VSAGRIGRPHGLDGSFHVADAKRRLLHVGGLVTVRGRSYEVERVAGTEGSPILRLAGVSDRDGARELAGAELLLATEELPQLDEGEWWAYELEGCAVHDRDLLLGTVRRMLELPSCEVLEVARADGGAPLLVPMVRDAVRSVDVERQRIEVDARFLGEER